jgi:hypothetical protein
MHLLDPRRRNAPGPAAEPADLVLTCHARIRESVALGGRIAAAVGAPPEEIASAAARALRYFREALPLHEQDEEASIKPRLLASPARAELGDAIATMVGEHDVAHAILNEIDPLWARLTAEPEALASIRAPLADAQRALALLFERHLAGEERAIVPAIARVLPPEERAVLLIEMRARRTPGGG